MKVSAFKAKACSYTATTKELTLKETTESNYSFSLNHYLSKPDFYKIKNDSSIIYMAIKLTDSPINHSGILKI
jgi:hypothetical protein